MSGRIFVSHSSKDKEIAERIYNDLVARQVPCWMAPNDIEPGFNYQSSIVRAIREAKTMLLVFTAAANDSREVAKEIALANKYSLLIIPARIDNVSPSDALEYELTTRQWHDLVGDWPTAMDGLAARIKRAHREGEVPEAGAMDSTPPPERKPPPEAAPVDKPTYRHTEPLRPPPEGFYKGPTEARPVAAQGPLSPILVQLQWAAVALIALGIGHLGALTLASLTFGLEGAETILIVMGMFFAFAGETAIGMNALQARGWTRWPAFALCVIGAGISFWLAVMLGADHAMDTEDKVEQAVFIVACAGVLLFPLSGIAFLRWKPAH